MGGAGNFQQVQVAGLVLGQEQHVEPLLVQLRIFVLHRSGGQVTFDADNRLDPGRFAGAVKLHRAVHGAMVGKGQGRHLQLLGAGGQIVDATEAVQQGKFAVNVKVGEGFVCVGHDR